MANKTSLSFPVTPGNTDRRFKLVRPTTLNWNDLQTTIRPVAGQSIRIRESAEVGFNRSDTTLSSMIWDNRFQQEAFLGHYQITRVGDTGTVPLVTERGNMIGQSVPSTSAFTWHFQREYNLELFLNKSDKNAAFVTAITNCNADLAPGAVPNRYIDTTNVDTYVRIAYGIATGDLPNAATLIDNLTKPTTAGYRFPDEVLFRGINNIPSVNLDGYEIITRLGDVELWVHPDWTIDTNFYYTFEVINYKVLAQTFDQFPDNTTCAYPGGVGFPQ